MTAAVALISDSIVDRFQFAGRLARIVLLTTAVVFGAFTATVALLTSRAGQGPAAVLRAGFVTSAFNPKIVLFYGSVFATALPAEPPTALVLAASRWSMPPPGCGTSRWRWPCRSRRCSAPTSPTTGR